MQVKSPAYLYSERELKIMREGIHFAPISKKYKYLIRNMIKLLALHDIYTTEERGNYINKKRKTKAAREKPRWEHTGRLRHTPPRTGPQYRNHGTDHIYMTFRPEPPPNSGAEPSASVWQRIQDAQQQGINARQQVRDNLAEQQSFQPESYISNYRRLYN